MSCREIHAEHTYTTTSPEAMDAVMTQLPEACRRVVHEAARTPGKWWPYDVIEKKVGLKPTQFASGLGGYRSHEPDRARPFHIGKQLASGRFCLMVDAQQAGLIRGADL